jgi:hypothetical protein
VPATPCDPQERLEILGSEPTPERRLTGSFDLSLQSIYGLAPMVGAWLIVGTDGHGLGTDWPPPSGSSSASASAPRSGSSTAS